MTSILRGSLSSKVIKSSTLSVCRQRGIYFQSWRSYSYGSYNGEGEYQPEDRVNKPTRDIEHPGPPPPRINKGPASSSSSQFQPEPDEGTCGADDGAEIHAQISTRPSNNARPTLNDGRQSPNIDENGNTRPDVPEDVKRHNAEMENRHDRSYNQLREDGKVQRGFWKIPK